MTGGRRGGSPVVLRSGAAAGIAEPSPPYRSRRRRLGWRRNASPTERNDPAGVGTPALQNGNGCRLKPAVPGTARSSAGRGLREQATEATNAARWRRPARPTSSALQQRMGFAPRRLSLVNGFLRFGRDDRLGNCQREGFGSPSSVLRASSLPRQREGRQRASAASYRSNLNGSGASDLRRGYVVRGQGRSGQETKLLTYGKRRTAAGLGRSGAPALRGMGDRRMAWS